MGAPIEGAQADAQRPALAVVADTVAVKRSAAVTKEELKAALVAENGSVGKAAARLGVKPGSIYKLVKKHALEALQSTLAKEAAAARHVAAVEERKKRERERVRDRRQIMPQTPQKPQAAPELTVEPAPQQQQQRPRQEVPQRRNPPGGYVRCPPDPRIRHGGFDLDKPVVNRRY